MGLSLPAGCLGCSRGLTKALAEPLASHSQVLSSRLQVIAITVARTPSTSSRPQQDESLWLGHTSGA
jgi:hypothetical protein